MPSRNAPTPAAKPEPGPIAKAFGCLIVGAVLAGLALGGFWLLGSAFSGNDAPVAAPPTSAAANVRAELETLYVATLQAQGVPVPDKAGAIASGRVVCAAFDRGADPVAFAVSFAKGAGLTVGQAGTVMGAAVAAFCPQHRAVIDSLAGR